MSWKHEIGIVDRIFRIETSEHEIDMFRKRTKHIPIATAYCPEKSEVHVIHMYLPERTFTPDLREDDFEKYSDMVREAFAKSFKTVDGEYFVQLITPVVLKRYYNDSAFVFDTDTDKVIDYLKKLNL